MCRGWVIRASCFALPVVRTLAPPSADKKGKGSLLNSHPYPHQVLVSLCSLARRQQGPWTHLLVLPRPLRRDNAVCDHLPARRARRGQLQRHQPVPSSPEPLPPLTSVRLTTVRARVGAERVCVRDGCCQPRRAAGWRAVSLRREICRGTLCNGTANKDDGWFKTRQSSSSSHERVYSPAHPPTGLFSSGRSEPRPGPRSLSLPEGQQETGGERTGTGQWRECWAPRGAKEELSAGRHSHLHAARAAPTLRGL